MNITIQSKTLKVLLERARDIDTPTRRALYGKLLPALGDFRHLSMADRAKILRWGLRDRDDGVRKAMGRTFRERWIEDCATAHNPIPEEQRKPGEVAPPSMEALTELLERISVIETGAIDDETGEPGIAHLAMREFWDGRPDYREDLLFDDDFWNDLTAESAFVARTFNDYCTSSQSSRMADLLESKMPTATQFAFFLGVHLNRLVKGIERLAGPEGEDNQELEEACEQQEFVVQQLLSIALTLDCSDWHGMGQMFNMSRDSLQKPQLPEGCTKLAVELLRYTREKTEEGEREFCAVIYESITEVRDSLSPVIEKEDEPEEEESFHSAQSDISDTIQVKPRKGQPKEELDPEAQEEERFRQMLVYLKCLHIAECALKEVYCAVPDDEAAPLTMMFNKLIIPAIRSHELVIREAGLRGLALCCILTKVSYPSLY
jgi:condensin complex subunit 3